MKLTQYSDYSLRVLMYLGINDASRATITEIATAYGISRNHIVKVVHQLGQLHYIETVRGKNGGLRLACHPEQINTGQVIRDTEASMAVVECFSDDNQCVLTPACVLRDVLGEALQAFLAVLDRYTLADLIAPRSQLADLLIPSETI